MSNDAGGSIVLLVCLLLPGCSGREKASFDPPEDLIANGLAVHAEPEGLHEAGEIQAAKPFVVTGEFLSKSRLRDKVIIRASKLRDGEPPTTMQSGFAEVTADEGSKYSYKACLKGIRKPGNYVVQVLYGRKVVDEVDIVVH